MHESLLLSRVVTLIEDRLANHPTARVLAVRLAVGWESHLLSHDPATVRLAFKMATAGSRLEGATLEIDALCGAGGCEECGDPYDEADPRPMCKRCGAVRRSVVEEPVCYLKEVVLEEPEQH